MDSFSSQSVAQVNIKSLTACTENNDKGVFMSLLLNQSRVRSKVLQVSASSILAGLAIMLPLQASYATPAIMAQLSSYCASHGGTSRVTSCAECHTGTAPSDDNATTSSARLYESGNYSAFCSVAAPTPPPIITPPPVMLPPPVEITPPPRPTPPPRVEREHSEDSSGARQGRESDSGSSSQRRRGSTSRSDD